MQVVVVGDDVGLVVDHGVVTRQTRLDAAVAEVVRCVDAPDFLGFETRRHLVARTRRDEGVLERGGILQRHGIEFHGMCRREAVGEVQFGLIGEVVERLGVAERVGGVGALHVAAVAPHRHLAHFAADRAVQSGDVEVVHRP